MKLTRPRLRRAAGWLALSLACFAGFFELAEDFAYSPKVMAFDRTVSAWATSFRTPPLTSLMIAVTVMGGTVAVSVMAVSLALFTARQGHPRRALYVLVVLVGGVTLSTLMKNLFERPRPPMEGALIALPASFSFPSGHSMGSLCLAWAFSYLVIRSGASRGRVMAAVTASVLYALAVGFSRVYLGVHYPSDVLASWLLGAGWIALATAVYRFVVDPPSPEASSD